MAPTGLLGVGIHWHPADLLVAGIGNLLTGPFMRSESPRHRVLALLATEDNRAAEEALLEAMPFLEPEVQVEAVDVLLQREANRSLARVVGRFTEQPPAVQERLRARGHDLHAPLRIAMTGGSYEDRAGAINLIVELAEPRLAYLLSDGLRVNCPRTRTHCAEGIEALTGVILDRSREVHTAEEAKLHQDEIRFLLEALTRAIRHWEIHFQPSALRAALWGIEWLEDSFARKLAEPRTKILHAIEGLLDGSSDPRLAGAMLRVLAIEDLRATAARAIGQARDLRFLLALLDEVWLLADPAIRRSCRWIRTLRCLDEFHAELRQIPRAQVVSLVRLIGASGLHPREKVERLQAVATPEASSGRQRSLSHDEEEHEPVLLAAALELIRLTHASATETLTAWAQRFRGSVGRLAAREVRRREGSDRNLAPGREVAPPGRPAGAAGTAASENRAATREQAASTDPASPSPRDAGLSFEDVWAQFDDMFAGDAATSLVQTVSKAEDWVGLLRQRMTSSQPLHRIRALRLTRALNLERALAAEVYHCTHDADPITRSLAIALLAVLPGATARRRLREALQDPDERVQANAIEALETLELTQEAPAIQTKLRSRNSRVRANSVKALLKLELREAADALLEMLEDEASAHRLSALWVVERMRLLAVAQRVEELAQADPDSRVRRRAQRVRQRWSGAKAK
jgi:hypothetical protein